MQSIVQFLRTGRGFCRRTNPASQWGVEPIEAIVPPTFTSKPEIDTTSKGVHIAVNLLIEWLLDEMTKGHLPELPSIANPAAESETAAKERSAYV